jgi:membrane-bound lytic murein transglycosylase A
MKWLLPAGLLLVLAGCVPPPGATPPTATGEAARPVMGLTAVGFDQLPGWPQDHAAQALAPFVAGCAKMGDTLGGSGEAATRGGTAGAWKPACDAARAVPAGNDSAARAFFEEAFQPYAIRADGKDSGLFTGYYEPEMAGSRSPGAGYDVPLLARPADLISVDLGAFADDLKGRRITGRLQQGAALVPYFDRTEIEAGALRSKRLELIWLADPVDAFFLQIQGSGRIRLPDGKVARVTYAAQNGRPYVPIGRVLADQGAIALDQVSMQTIRAWLAAHPAEAARVMDRNPSYVFFREMAGVRPDEGPPGALGVALTPGRSVAVDRGYLPLGAPVFVDTTDPLDGSRLQRMTVAQDLGGAIKGPVRADIFFGWGRDAENHAGQMHQQGRAFVLLPKGAPGA